MNTSYALYQQRRNKLVALVKQEMADFQGPIVFFSRFETERMRFRQDSSFYYFSGIEEPGAVMVIDLDGRTTLFVPDYSQGKREQWVDAALTPAAGNAEKHGVQVVVYAGQPLKGYALSSLFSVGDYEHLIARLQREQAIGVCMPTYPEAYKDQVYCMQRLQWITQGKLPEFRDISSLVGRMRRTKSRDEVELVYKAVELTMVAQEAAARSIGDGTRERTVQAGIEYIFIEGGGRSYRSSRH